MFSELDDYIKNQLDKFRLGVYIGKLGAKLDKYNRTEILPSFLREPLTKVRKVASPIMDIEGLKDSNVAVISQDGVISFPLNLGVIFDDKFGPEEQTVWIRARLQTSPGSVDIGGTKGFRVVVGSKKAAFKPLGKGKVSIGNGTGEIVADTLTTAESLKALVDALKPFISAISAAETKKFAANAITPGSGDALFVIESNAAELSILGPLKPDLLSVIKNLTSLKE